MYIHIYVYVCIHTHTHTHIGTFATSVPGNPPTQKKNSNLTPKPSKPTRFLIGPRVPPRASTLRASGRSRLAVSIPSSPHTCTHRKSAYAPIARLAVAQRPHVVPCLVSSSPGNRGAPRTAGTKQATCFTAATSHADLRHICNQRARQPPNPPKNLT